MGAPRLVTDGTEAPRSEGRSRAWEAAWPALLPWREMRALVFENNLPRIVATKLLATVTPRAFVGPLAPMQLREMGALFADEIAYRYEGDVFPSTTEGWITGLGKTCTQLLSNGFLINSWPAGQGSYSAHQRIFGDSSNPPPSPPFWAEWRFASNNAIHGSFLGDGQFFWAI